MKQYNEATKDEKIFLYQKARIEWLRDGDRNSAFFHKIIKGRLHINRVLKICNEKGESFDGEDVANQFVEHFTKYLGNSCPVQELRDSNSLFQQKVSEEDALQIIKEVTDEEIKTSMFDIGDSKAPGPDGDTAKFYKSAWEVVGMDVCRAVKQFFQDGQILGE